MKNLKTVTLGTEKKQYNGGGIESTPFHIQDQDEDVEEMRPEIIPQVQQDVPAEDLPVEEVNIQLN